MKRIFLIFLAFLICLPVLCSCTYHTDHISKKGLEHFRKSQYADSSFDIAGQLFLSVDFLDKYSYSQGDYNYDYVGDLFFANTTDRAFAWLTYEEEIYEQAKQECLETRHDENADLDGKEAFGFTFYSNYEWGQDNEYKYRFPYYFTAFGFNDQTDTLVFIGFYCNKQSDEEKLKSAKTDLEGFIQNYFGKWYDWE